MICNVCGTQVEEGMMVCNCCGNAVMGQGYYIPVLKKKSKAKWIIVISSILAILIATITIVLIVVLSDDEEKYRRTTIDGTLEVFFEAIQEGNYDKYMSLVPVYWQSYLRGSLDSVMRNALKEYNNEFYCYTGNNQLHFEITDLELLEGYDLLEIQEDFGNWYDATGIEAYAYVDITVRDINGHEWTFSEFDLIRIDGIWYMGYGKI